MRWFLDTEFNEDGRTIELISIALVSEDGETYHQVSSEFNREACNDWVKANVLPHLPDHSASRAQIAEDIRNLLLRDGPPEIWGYFCDYDWVALCQLFGPMVDLPQGFPMLCLDLKQEMHRWGLAAKDFPGQEGMAHDALADAQWIRKAVMSLGWPTASGDWNFRNPWPG